MALLELTGITRTYPAGEDTVTALDGVSLSIAAGEMVAIMGASGSGKSTLMNILGCLDRPTTGSYRVAGQNVATLDGDALARLRRERFGFIFQRYHLLPHLDALGNVEIPAVYAGYDKHARAVRAASLLARLGLAGRARHRPNQLSGGQQQRVSIARALMNGGEIILADEPSGALDCTSGGEVMKILRELHGQGHTIIIVTHDPEIAAHAERVVEIRDGRIVHDTGRPAAARPAFDPAERPSAVPHGKGWATLAQWIEALKMALHAMTANRMRSALTMLGIVIGITSVVSIMALSEGAKNSVLKSVRELAANTITIFRGRDWGDDQAPSIRTLLPGDMAAIAALPGIESVMPIADTGVRLRHRQLDVAGRAIGATTGSLRVFGVPLANGRDISGDEIRMHAQVAVIDNHTRHKLFTDGKEPLGQVILVGNLPCTVIGVAGPPTGLLAMNNDQSLRVWIPYTTAASHLLGRTYLDGMFVRARAGESTQTAAENVTRLLEQRHGKKDFFISNYDNDWRKINQVSEIMTLVLSLIAAISLMVGGVGVMNIMLVSVTERTREIGIRMAIGARQRDVQNQFLIESVTLCLVGGLIGVALTFGISMLVGLATDLFRMEVSLTSILAAFVTSSLIGVLFGFLPARNASRLDPIEALARD